MKKVVVVGAGVVGAATALALAEKGMDVTVIDKADRPAAGASAANGAQLSYSYADALASPATLKLLPRFLLGIDPVFRLVPSMDPDAFKWSLKFLKNCQSWSRADENTLAVLQLGMRSSVVMSGWQQRYPFDIHYRQAGKLLMHEDPQAFHFARRRAELKRRFGVRQEVLSREEMIEREPALADMQADLVGGVLSPDDYAGNAAEFTRQALRFVTEKYQGRVLLQTECKALLGSTEHFVALKTSAGELQADYFVLCAGYQTPLLGRQLQVSLPVVPMAGYSLTYPATEKTPEISLTDASQKIVLCRLGHELRLAGLADVGFEAKELPRHRIETLRQIVRKRFPQAADYQVEDDQAWVGMRPMVPDGRPIIRRHLNSNLFFNCGHGMLGWTLSAGSADMIAEKIAS